MRRIRFAVVLWVCAVLAALFAVNAQMAHGASFVVNTIDDDPGIAKQCSGAAGDCSLRGAMTRANLSTEADTITFHSSIAGATITIGSALPALSGGGDTIDGTGKTITIKGDEARTFSCLVVSSANNTVSGLAFTDCARGIWLDGNTSDNNNVIGDHFYDNGIGITVGTSFGSDATGNFLGGNKFGTTADGTVVHPDGGNGTGIGINSGSNNTIGSLAPPDRNIISGNGSGIVFAGGSANSVVGNYIGTSASGTVDLGNDGAGIFMNNVFSPVTNNLVANNLISGNSIANVAISVSAANNTVANNIIGPDAGGSGPTMDNGIGVSIYSGAHDNTIGPGNVISDNGTSGIFNYAPGIQISGTGATGNVVKGNYIGTYLTNGTVGVPNGTHGVLIDTGASGNTIGTPTPGEGNAIAFNTQDGVRVDGTGSGGTTISNSIRGNSIHDNGELGINNVLQGNLELPPPTIVGTGAVFGTSSCSSCTIDVYSDGADEGRRYEGTTVADVAGDWSFSGPVDGPNVTATVTDADGNTSEFSAAFPCVDEDADGVCNSGDTCPFWPNPSQGPLPWPVPADDPDCDGFTTTRETYLGTESFAHCAANSGANNDPPPDAWPVDFDDNQIAGLTDVQRYIPVFNTPVPQPPGTDPARQRFDLDGNGVVGLTDVQRFIPFFNKSCA